MFNATRLAVAAAGLIVASSAANAATTTFFQFFQDSTAKLLDVSRVAGTTTFSATNVPVDGSLQAFAPGVPYLETNLLMNFTASSSAPVTQVGDAVSQDGYAGTISFLSGATNVLTVTFDNALTASLIGAESGTFSSDSSQANITGTSDVFDLSQLVSGNFSFAITALSVPVSIEGDYSTSGNIAGTFAAAIPEPATWAMMISGFGLVGFAARRRRTQATVA